MRLGQDVIVLGSRTVGSLRCVTQGESCRVLEMGRWVPKRWERMEPGREEVLRLGLADFRNL